MKDFIAGADPKTLPMLYRMMGRFRFVLTSERWVEALHAASRHWLVSAHRAGPVHVAYHSMLPTLRAKLRRHPQALEALVDHCNCTKTGYAALQAMGLNSHPLIQQMLLAHKKKAMSRKMLPE
eukprot:8657163-Pyramimonas_sp.AAC.1